jgi:UDP-MurNAc hydroxylase
VRITATGHAGLFVETTGGSVLCDPWFVPAFHGSWFVFPRNDGLDTSQFVRPDYLYVSHLHGDHFDAPFLQERVDKTTPVLLPDFPTPELERALRSLGFESFIRCADGEPVALADDLEITIFTATAPSDGPIGDSAILIKDPTGSVLDQNDCRPNHPEDIAAQGPIDVHFLQYSGAMWWPVVYELPAADKARYAAAKRENQMQRAIGYAVAIGAEVVVPSAGPPCFVDPDLFDLNDFDRASDNIFPDQTVFLDRADVAGLNAQLTIAGTIFDIDTDGIAVTQPLPADELEHIFTHKREYLTQYQADWADWLDKERASWPEPRPHLVERIKVWWEPLLALAPNTRQAIGRKLLLRAGDEDVLVDFLEAEVRAWDGDESYQYLLDLPRPLVEWCVEHRAVDWSNSLFLSLRFSAWRPGDYCEELFSFLKSLNPERLAVLEEYLAKKQAATPIDDEIAIGEYMVERRCPHKGADLGRFGEVDGCVLTCNMHGWQFDLETGACLNHADHPISARRSPADRD